MNGIKMLRKLFVSFLFGLILFPSLTVMAENRSNVIVVADNFKYEGIAAENQLDTPMPQLKLQFDRNGIYHQVNLEVNRPNMKNSNSVMEAIWPLLASVFCIAVITIRKLIQNI
jgi:hypothetical protein